MNQNYTTQTVPFASILLNGGLNSTSAPMKLQDSESSDLQNIDFSKDGSIKKRGGYVCLNTNSGVAIGADGLYWYEYVVSSSTVRQAVRVYNAQIQKMDDLDGTWDNITGAVTITSANPCDFETFYTSCFITNNTNPPVRLAGADTAGTANVPSGLTKGRCVRKFSNYLFYANVTVSGVYYPTRVYFSALNDPTTWDSADWVEVGRTDGQEIVALKELGDRLVVMKLRSIYNIYYTGDVDIPFIVQKSNSTVGCISQFSVQEVENGLTFLSHDGIYFYDGLNSYKISDQITTTLQGFNTTRFSQVKSSIQKNKNMILWSFPDASSTNNDKIVAWDYFNKAFSIYKGINASAMSTFYVSGIEERPYFTDYNGFTYRGDIGNNDYPLNTATAIDAYYYSNWRAFGDFSNQKAIPQVYIYYQSDSTTLSFAYSYDFESGDQYTNTFSLSAGASLWDTMVWDRDLWAGQGGKISRVDLQGRGRVARLKIANCNLNETFTVDGIGMLPYLETFV
jgi:hypothetical protein